jgi:RNA polymerase sigma-70 factor, ECF subfamily
LPSQSFEAFVEEHSRQILNLALRILGDAEAAQDVHQEVFLAIWRRWHKFGARTNWNGYLYRTTMRKSIELARRVRAEPLFERNSEDPPGNTGPDATVRAAELHRRLAACLVGLPRRQADAFVLSRLEGLGHKRIAEILGCSEPTVRVHLYRATKRLARELEEFRE